MKQSLFTLFVKQFYKLNSGFFLLCVLIFFGIMNFRDTVYFHYSVMERAGDPKALLLLLGIWLLYSVKCFGFGVSALQQKANHFLYHLQGLRDVKQMFVLAQMQTLIYLPALVYATITAGVVFSKGKLAAGTIILLYQIAIVLLPCLIYKRKLNNTYSSNPLDEIFERFSIDNKKRFEYWLLQYLMHNKKRALFGIKVSSLLLLQALVTYNYDHLNFESVCFLMMGLIIAHAILPFYVRGFIEERLVILRALPLTLFKRFLWFAFTYALLLLPELIFLLLHVNGAVPLLMIVLIYLISVAQLCLFSSLLYVPGVKLETYMVLVAVVFFLSIFSLAALPAWLFATIIFGLSLLLFVLFYERRESRK